MREERERETKERVELHIYIYIHITTHIYGAIERRLHPGSFAERDLLSGRKRRAKREIEILRERERERDRQTDIEISVLPESHHPVKGKERERHDKEVLSGACGRKKTSLNLTICSLFPPLSFC